MCAEAFVRVCFFEAVISGSNLICTQSPLHYEKQDMHSVFTCECVSGGVFIQHFIFWKEAFLKYPLLGN